MSSRTIASLGAVLTVVVGTTRVFGASIDIFPVVGGVTEFASCSASIQPFMAPIILGVYVRLDASLIEVSGAEGFIRTRQGGLTGPVLDLQSQGWTFSVTNDPLSTVSYGDPINPGGTVADPRLLGIISFPFDELTGFCNRGVNGFVHLWNILIFNFATSNVIPPDTYLVFEDGDPPSNVNFDCPAVTQCDAPAFSIRCLGVPTKSGSSSGTDGGRAGAFILNPSGRTCLVAVEEETWGRARWLAEKTLHRGCGGRGEPAYF